jgi:hypothetical protein
MVPIDVLELVELLLGLDADHLHGLDLEHAGQLLDLQIEGGVQLFFRVVLEWAEAKEPERVEFPICVELVPSARERDFLFLP